MVRFVPSNRYIKELGFKNFNEIPLGHPIDHMVIAYKGRGELLIVTENKDLEAQLKNLAGLAPSFFPKLKIFTDYLKSKNIDYVVESGHNPI